MMAKREEIIDRASGRLIVAGPEKIDATQPLLTNLIEERGWDPNQIVSRPTQWRVPGRRPWMARCRSRRAPPRTSRRSPSGVFRTCASPSQSRAWPVVAIFDSPSHVREADQVRVLCQCKRPDESTGLRQFKIYLDREPPARAGIWFNGIDHAVIYKTRQGYQQAPAGTPILGPGDPLEPDGTPTTLTYDQLSKAASLVPLFNRIRNRLAARDANVNRDEEILPALSSLLSKNIGLSAAVMPWQTDVVLTKGIAVLGCAKGSRISPWLLVVILSLRVVSDQFRFLVQMPTHREDLGRSLLELQIPLPMDASARRRWEKPAEAHFPCAGQGPRQSLEADGEPGRVAAGRQAHSDHMAAKWLRTVLCTATRGSET